VLRESKILCAVAVNAVRYTRSPDEDKAGYIAVCRDKHELVDRKKKLYWSQCINAVGDSPRTLLCSSTALFQRDHRSADVISPTCNNADDFLLFFDQIIFEDRTTYAETA